MNLQWQLALALLLGLLGSLGCKTPWSSSAASPTASSPNLGQHQYDALSKDFAAGNKSGVGGPATPASDNWLVSGWKKTTSAIASPFASKSPAVDTDDPVSLSSKPKKVGSAVYIAAAQALENNGKFAEAEAQYQRGLKNSPKDLNTLISLARCYDRQGKQNLAIETYRTAIKAHPKSALAHNDLGLCYGRQRATNEAVQHLTKAIELQTDNVRYRNNLATVLVEAGRTNEAFQQLVAVNPEAVAHYNLACLLHTHGKPEVAATHLQLALQKDANLTPARELLAQLNVNTRQGDTRVAALPVSTSSTLNTSANKPAAPGPYSPQAHGASPNGTGSTGYGGAAAPQPSMAPQNSYSPWR